MKPLQSGQNPALEQVLGSAAVLETSRVEGDGPVGRLPLTPDMLHNEPSGNIFGLTQNAGMGLAPRRARRTAIRDCQHDGWPALGAG